jgi:hypothetical protein
MDDANTKDEAAKAELTSLGGTGTKPTRTTTSTTTSTDKKEAVPGSLSDLESKLSDLKKKYKDGVLKIAPDDYLK